MKHFQWTRHFYFTSIENKIQLFSLKLNSNWRKPISPTAAVQRLSIEKKAIKDFPLLRQKDFSSGCICVENKFHGVFCSVINIVVAIELVQVLLFNCFSYSWCSRMNSHSPVQICEHGPGPDCTMQQKKIIFSNESHYSVASPLT